MPNMEAEDEIKRLQFWAGDATVAPVVPTVRATHPREAVGEDAAAQVAADVALLPRRHAPAHGVGVLRLGEKGLEVMLHHRVEGRLGGTAGGIDGTGRAICRRSGGSPTIGGRHGTRKGRAHVTPSPKPPGIRGPDHGWTSRPLRLPQPPFDVAASSSALTHASSSEEVALDDTMRPLPPHHPPAPAPTPRAPAPGAPGRQGPRQNGHRLRRPPVPQRHGPLPRPPRRVPRLPGRLGEPCGKRARFLGDMATQPFHHGNHEARAPRVPILTAEGRSSIPWSPSCPPHAFARSSAIATRKLAPPNADMVHHFFEEPHRRELWMALEAGTYDLRTRRRRFP